MNDDVPGAGYDARWLRIDAYRYCWKVFFTSEDTLRLYQEYSLDDGKNGENAVGAALMLDSIKAGFYG